MKEKKYYKINRNAPNDIIDIGVKGDY